jgi:hypothetical protein
MATARLEILTPDYDRIGRIGVIRVWDTKDFRYGDPYSWVCVVRFINDDSVEMVGQLQPPTKDQWNAIGAELRCWGVRRSMFVRYRNGVRREHWHGDKRPPPPVSEDFHTVIGRIGVRLGIACRQGAWDRALRIIEEAKRCHRDHQKDQMVTLNDRLALIGITQRMCEELWAQDVRNVGQLLWYPKAKFLSIAGFSETKWNKCVDALQDYGYKHGMSEDRIIEYAAHGFLLSLIQPPKD